MDTILAKWTPMEVTGSALMFYLGYRMIKGWFDE